ARRRRTQLLEHRWLESQPVEFGAEAALAEPLHLVGQRRNHHVIAGKAVIFRHGRGDLAEQFHARVTRLAEKRTVQITELLVENEVGTVLPDLFAQHYLLPGNALQAIDARGMAKLTQLLLAPPPLQALH